MKTFPDNVLPFTRTPLFDESSIPPALLSAHQTKEGIWGKIILTSGVLVYRILEPSVQEIQLTPGQVGIIEPGTKHEVEPVGQVQFYVQLYR